MILFIILYIVIWPIMSILLSRLLKFDSDEAVMFGFLWPITIVSAPFAVLIEIISRLVKRYGYKKEYEEDEEEDNYE